MAKKSRIIGDMFSELRRERRGEEPRFSARALKDPHEIEDARRLAIQKFARLGKIPKEEVDENGLLVFDPFLEKSTFFGVYDAENDAQLAAVARLIWSKNATVDDMRLPIEKIDPQYAEMLQNAEPGTIAEFGSLAKRSREVPNVAVLKLISEIFSFAEHHEIENIVCGLEPKLYPTYKQMFGGALNRLKAENIEFPGIEGEQVPLVINVEDGLSYDPGKMYAGKLGHIAVGFPIRYFLRNTKKDSEGLQKQKV